MNSSFFTTKFLGFDFALCRGGSRNLFFGGNQGPQSRIKGEARIEGAKQIKSNQFIVQHNITYKKFTKIIQAYYHYGCTMESGEARLLEP